jgi:hypothetical protein
MNLYQKLHKIQSQVLGLGKDKDGQNYKYVTGTKVLDHLKPLMNDLGIILKQEVISIENVRQDYIIGFGTPKQREKSEILSKVMMKFTWIDVESGHKDENLFGANGQNDWDKGVGSALTYAERYFLLKYFHIATDEDDIDNPERKEEEQRLAKEEEQRIEKVKLSLDKCKTEEKLKELYLSLSKTDQVTFKVYVTQLKEILTSK